MTKTSFKKINMIIYFENLIVRLHILYSINIYRQILFQLNGIYYMIHKLIFMDNFRLQILQFKQFIDDLTIDL